MGAIPIAVDVMGGDYAPSAILEGVGEFLDSCDVDEFKLCLVGLQEQIESGLRKIGKAGHPSIEIIHASEVIGMQDHGVTALRSKPDSSINVAVKLVKAGRAAGLFTAGSTAAAVACAYLRWHMLPGLDRPCIATVLPHEKGSFILLDAGATVECSSLNLAQFAVIGDIYARHVLNRKEPAVGLLSNGTEVGKGNRLTKDAFELIREVSSLNFIGNVEGHDLFSGKVDVVVCEGFVGNIVLKSCEQMAKSMGAMLKEQLMKRFSWKMGALLSRGAFQEFRKSLDPAEVGGAPLLGVNGCCVIGHGNSNAKAVKNGIHMVGRMAKKEINQAIVEQIQLYGLEHLVAFN